MSEKSQQEESKDSSKFHDIIEEFLAAKFDESEVPLTEEDRQQLKEINLSPNKMKAQDFPQAIPKTEISSIKEDQVREAFKSNLESMILQYDQLIQNAKAYGMSELEAQTFLDKVFKRRQ